jgi:hypothetical protein
VAQIPLRIQTAQKIDSVQVKHRIFTLLAMKIISEIRKAEHIYNSYQMVGTTESNTSNNKKAALKQKAKEDDDSEDGAHQRQLEISIDDAIGTLRTVCEHRTCNTRNAIVWRQVDYRCWLT